MTIAVDLGRKATKQTNRMRWLKCLDSNEEQLEYGVLLFKVVTNKMVIYAKDLVC